MKTLIVKIIIGTALALFLVFPLLFLSGCATTSKVEPAIPALSVSPKICPPHLQKLCMAYDTVRIQYLKEIPDEELTDMFIHGFIKELSAAQKDPYISYLSKTDKKTEAVTNEHYAGIGVDMKKDTKPPYAIKVQRIFRGTPASKAGLRRGDQITSINGTPLADKTVEESRDLIRGKIGTPITLGISRSCEKEPFRVSIRRGYIEDNVSGIAQMISPHYAYVFIPSFEAEKHVALRVKYSLAKFSETYGKPYGLIIDFRNNPGGNVLETEYFVSLFLGQGNIFYKKVRNGTEYPARVPENNRDILPGVPIAILMNEDAKSSAEIAAGAMQDSKRAVIVGTKSFGKGVLQTKYLLGDSSELRLTTAYTFTPRHAAINGAGITPDVLVEEGDDESCTGDNQLAAAIDILKKKRVQKTVVAQK
jgi:carboxyl-terminal processing protease